MSNRYRLGIDIGGTFTDFTLIDTTDGSSVGIKSPTDAFHPEEGIRKGIRILKNEYGLKAEEVEYFVHGMTIGLNTLLQRKGSKLALFVTEGFRDILNLQRLRLPVPFDIHSTLPEPLISRDMVFEISERLLSDGSEYKEIDYDILRKACEKAIKNNAEGIAICFINSYKNPAHEIAAKEWIEENYSELKVCASSILWPQIREYERACIAVINLYIQKNVKTYFEDLKRMLKEEGFVTDPFISQSNGGIMDLNSAADAPIRTIFSGPAAGVIGAIRAAELSGEKNLLTFDVGGTSTDVALVEDGNPEYTLTSSMDGLPIHVPTIDISSIGAGGGSVGWIDQGLLKLGPESAGSYPGPACYGRSELATLTDAFLVCGYLNPDNFAAGRMSLDINRSYAAIEKIAKELGTDVETTADKMVQVAISNMYVELSNIFEQKGVDPREWSVVAYGGGGPVTASFVADEIHAKNVLVSYRPGTLCSLGALTADFANDASLSVQKSSSEISKDTLKTLLNEVKERAELWLKDQKAEVLKGAPVTIKYLADARYQGQAYEIQYEIDENSDLTELFHKQHELMYGHSEREAEVEVMTIRARIEAKTPEIASVVLEKGGKLSPIGSRKVIIKGTSYKANIYNRTDILAGDILKGPAIIEQSDTTVLVLPGWTGRSDKFGNLILTKGDE